MIGVFGRIEKRKGQDILIQACSDSVADYPDLRLLVVGDYSDDSYKALMKTAVDRLNLVEHVVFTGRRSDVDKLLSLCDVVVMPSRSEAMGRVLLESWAARRPVVGSEVEGIREIVSRSGGGLLYPSESPSALAAAVKTLLDDEALRTQLAARGFDWVREACDPERYAERFLAFIATLGPASRMTASAGGRFAAE